ncbi:D-hexose-6-phosphate mutarotase [Luteococcus sp. H138]|uniref:D-hexose-6-phosphate mutarotase n=1 Tax=unclassified Luteococcus TaxID=2639923 RepID=UPI00313AF3A2
MSTHRTAPELPQGITFVKDHGQDAYRIETELCTGLVHVNGAHVTEWTPAGQDPVLWLSKDAVFGPGKAIRGGIPICWPWFGPGRDGDRSPAHGIARLLPWSLVEADVSEAGEARLSFELAGGELPESAGVPADATVRYTVGFGSVLNLDLTVTAGAQPVSYEEALHTYLAVGDVHRVTLEGLADTRYLDKVGDGEITQEGPVKFITETDRIYFSDDTVSLVDDASGRRIELQKTNSANTVVWNPWADKAAAMTDFGDDEWPTMCCIETVNCLANEISLSPGEQHTMSTTVLVP